MSDSPGRPPEVSTDEILACFREADDPVLTTAEVAACLPIEQRATLDYLEELETAGLLRSKAAGQALVWWLVDDTDS
jgi:hypothetical protein